MAHRSPPDSGSASLVESYPQPPGRTTLDTIAAIPEEHVWLASRESPRTRGPFLRDAELHRHSRPPRSPQVEQPRPAASGVTGPLSPPKTLLTKARSHNIMVVRGFSRAAWRPQGSPAAPGSGARLPRRVVARRLLWAGGCVRVKVGAKRNPSCIAVLILVGGCGRSVMIMRGTHVQDR